MIEIKIQQTLSALVDDRAYPTILPEQAKYPAITYHRVNAAQGSGRINTTDITGQNSVFQVVIWSKNYGQAHLLQKKCITEFAGLGLQLNSSADGFEPEKMLHSVIMEFECWGDLALTADRQSTPTKSPIKQFLHSVRQQLSGISETSLSDYQLIQPVLPTIVVKLQQIKPADDWNGPGAVKCFMAAHCYHQVGYAEDLAAQVSLKINANQWDLGEALDYPTDISADQQVMTLGGEPYERWQIKWQQVIRTEASIWQDSGTPPTTVLCSDAPEIGIPHEDDYRVVSSK
ncbi:hypothetical protein [Spartinivicinus marinus]|uniref:hypothetical protein n=1 Tax=Spartinivicinus marinus TaxID=2994442 RepID=UPI0022553887|nr:hypothetical protein [Spartinivicinus marinus]MCX4027936.1 hypothetical protein [Spartinivicinus marinus]